MLYNTIFRSNLNTKQMAMYNADSITIENLVVAIS